MLATNYGHVLSEGHDSLGLKTEFKRKSWVTIHLKSNMFDQTRCW